MNVVFQFLVLLIILVKGDIFEKIVLYNCVCWINHNGVRAEEIDTVNDLQYNDNPRLLIKLLSDESLLKLITNDKVAPFGK